MHCSKCGAESPDRAKFCVECASPFTRRCPSCNAENPPTAKFCLECAKPLEAETAPAEPSASSRRSEGGERRHLTVLFSDLVNSTEIAAHLDPEEWREIVASYHRATSDAVAKFGGQVAQYLGDGVIAFFGYPQAHDDNAERAVRAGLAILDAISETNRAPSGDNKGELAVRVGIHTGQVVMDEGDQGINAFGDAPNIAARVQAAAEPNSVFITSAVHKLVSGLFVVEDRDAHQLKGIKHPVQLYRAIQPTPARRRSHGTATAAQAPFVGREDEMRLLLSRWERACEGEGQLALVVGEPGIGKSRLVEEFRVRIKDQPHSWIECAGEQFSASTPFHAVIQILDQGLGWQGDESKEERVVQLERSLELTRLKPGEAVPLIAEMLNLPIPTKYPPLMFAPDQKRRRLLADLAAWVLNAARLQPVVIVLEDLQWVDPSTLELMQTLVEQAATAPLLLLYTARPEFRAPWPMRAHHLHVTLNRLNERHTREMVAGVTGSRALAKDVIDAVVRRTDGVPLFAEELTRLMLEGDGRRSAREIPDTLQDSLMARLDRLGSAKEVAQVGAVLGREFSYELLRAVSSMPDAELQAALAKLTDAELIYARGIAPDAQYQFKHALIQDAAYEALLKSRRKEFHRRTAEALLQRFAAVAVAQPEVLARHLADAGDAEPAIAAWKKAGDAAEARRAFKEAEESYRQALALLITQPESAQRDARELALQDALARVLMLIKGYAASQTLEAAARARSLAEKSGNLADRSRQLASTCAARAVAGDIPGSNALAEQLLDLARQEGSPASFAYAYHHLLLARFQRGLLVEAEEHYTRWNTVCEAPAYRQFRGAAEVPRGFASLNAWMLGSADSARKRAAQMIVLAQASNDPFALASAQFFESWLHYLLRNAPRAMAAANQALTLSEEHGFSLFTAQSQGILGWAQAQLGNPDEGISLIRRTLSGFGESRSRVNIPDILTRLAEAQALGGAVGEALGTIEDALQANPEELVFQPNILTRRGELRLKLGQSEPAEADFREAIALARKMSAKAWELRAATSLARMLQARGDCAAARDLLAPAYNWFTEGLDTPDLKDAKALLHGLSA